jgi:hypothetical protein
MAEPTAKIIKVDTSKLQPSNVTKDSPPAAWDRTSEVSFVVKVDHEGQEYHRKLTFVMHDQQIHHIGRALTVEDIEQAMLAEVEQIKSLHEVAAVFADEIDVDQVAKIKARALK